MQALLRKEGQVNMLFKDHKESSHLNMVTAELQKDAQAVYNTSVFEVFVIFIGRPS